MKFNGRTFFFCWCWCVWKTEAFFWIAICFTKSFHCGIHSHIAKRKFIQCDSSHLIYYFFFLSFSLLTSFRFVVLLFLYGHFDVCDLRDFFLLIFFPIRETNSKLAICTLNCWHYFDIPTSVDTLMEWKCNFYQFKSTIYLEKEEKFINLLRATCVQCVVWVHHNMIFISFIDSIAQCYRHSQ